MLFFLLLLSNSLFLTDLSQVPGICMDLVNLYKHMCIFTYKITVLLL